MTFEKHLRLVSRAVSQRLGILRKSWLVFHDKSLLGRCFRGFVLLGWEYCSVVWCWTVQSVVIGSQLGVCLSVPLLVVDLLQFCVCCIRSAVIRSTCLMMLYQCGLHAVPWLHIGMLMRRLAAEPRSTSYFCSPLSVPLERSFSPRIRWCGTGGFQLQRQCFFIGLSWSILTIVFYYFSLSLLSVHWLYCVAGIFWLIGCISLSLTPCIAEILLIMIYY